MTFCFRPGLSMVFPHGFSGFVNFDLLLGYEDFESYNFSFGMRYEF